MSMEGMNRQQEDIYSRQKLEITEPQKPREKTLGARI